MTDPLFFLNKDDRDALQLMLTWFKQRRSNLQSRSPLDLPGRSSDTYIAIPTLSDGIPPLVRTGTATGTFPEFNTDTPGYANCDIYQIVDIGDGSPIIIPLEFSVVVYNLSQSTISQDWITVNRDRFGTWLAIVGGGGTGTLQIRFSIYDPYTPGIDPCTVLANVLSRPFGVSRVPDEDTTGYFPQTVYVHDATGCYLNGPSEDLLGLGGHASYMTAVDSSDVDPGAAPGDIMPPNVGHCPGSHQTRWEITDMCCKQDRCDTGAG